jgi:hypothetical protein
MRYAFIVIPQATARADGRLLGGQSSWEHRPSPNPSLRGRGVVLAWLLLGATLAAAGPSGATLATAGALGATLATAGPLGAALAPGGQSGSAQPASAPSAATSQPTSTPGVPASQPAAGDDVRQQLADLQARLHTLETRHAAERAQDQRRIAELEGRVAELQDSSLAETRRRVYAEQVAAMRAEMARADGQFPTSRPVATSQPGAEGELEGLISGAAPTPQPEAKPAGIVGALQGAVQSFNPDISLNGDFLAQYRSHEGRKPTAKFDFRELEIGFSGAVDPYTRADVIATISHEGNGYAAGLEEAYLTFLQLPYNLQARVGEFRAEFGRANPYHLHALPWTDYPLVIQRYFGEEGLTGTGGELSWLIPNPWHQYIALTYEIMNNDNHQLFAGDQADDITHLLRLKTFRDLSPNSTLEAGASLATGPNDHGHGSHRSQVEGFDVTYRWKPKGAGLYKSFNWQTEVMAAQADIRGGQETTWGMYSAPEYQFSRRWKLGLRYDYTQLPFSSSSHEYAYSAYLTFLQSEFVFWRLAYTYLDRNFSDDHVRGEQRLMLQLNFTLGAHPAHKY